MIDTFLVPSRGSDNTCAKETTLILLCASANLLSFYHTGHTLTHTAMDGRLSEPPHSRPMTPESPLANSLYHATSNIDDLTLALANFSRVPSPEPPSRLPCCCGRDDCIHTTSWMALKSRLESRLILSAGEELVLSAQQRVPICVRQKSDRHYYSGMRHTCVDMRFAPALLVAYWPI